MLISVTGMLFNAFYDWLWLFVENLFVFLLTILVHWLFNLSYKSREDDQACQMCIMQSCIKTQPLLVDLFISHRCILLLCSKDTLSINIDDTLGTDACTQPHSHRHTHTDALPVDHRDLISYCHNTFIPHLFLGAVVSKRLLCAAKWQSGLLTVFFILSNGERWHGPRPSLSVALSKQG